MGLPPKRIKQWHRLSSNGLRRLQSRGFATVLSSLLRGRGVLHVVLDDDRANDIVHQRHPGR
jgi:hypothetical protein